MEEEKQIILLIGALAHSISEYWLRGTGYRLYCITDLCEKIGKTEWINNLDALWVSICDNGKNILHWCGPCSPIDSIYIFRPAFLRKYKRMFNEFPYTEMIEGLDDFLDEEQDTKL